MMYVTAAVVAGMVITMKLEHLGYYDVDF